MSCPHGDKGEKENWTAYCAPEFGIVTARYDGAFRVSSQLCFDIAKGADDFLGEADVEPVLGGLLEGYDEDIAMSLD